MLRRLLVVSVLASLGSSSLLAAPTGSAVVLGVMPLVPGMARPVGALATAEMGDHLVVLRSLPALRGAADGTPVTAALSGVYLAERRGGSSALDAHRDRIRILHEEGPFTFFQALPSTLKRLLDAQGPHFRVLPFDEDLRLRVAPARLPETPAPAEPGLAAAVSVERLCADVTAMEGFKTRYSYGEGYLASARWAVEAFTAMGYVAELQEYADYGKKQYNVVARSADEATDQGLFVVGGHLDSTSERPRDLAPGADDNASGSAGVLEIARVMAGTPMARRMRFALFAGEEMGMKGSRAYVAALEAAGELGRISGAVIFDMIGFDGTAPLTALFETKTFSDEFLAPFRAAAQAQGALTMTINYSPWGSDHVPFLSKKIPCFLFIESEYDDNPNYHRSTDCLGAMNRDLMLNIVTTTVAGLQAHLQ